jgi:hypothetical protein
MPTYNANIPQPTDQISQSQDQILQNFQAIQALIDINHVDFASGDQGKHKWVTLPNQAAIPPAGSGFAGGEIGAYNATNATTAVSELYLNKTNQATVVQVPSTASTLSINSAPAANAGGWTYLPSGLILKCGNASGVTGLTTVTLPSGVGVAPAFTQIIGVIVCPYSTSTSDVNFAVRFVDILSGSQFRVFVSSRTGSGSATGGFQFLAIGY